MAKNTGRGLSKRFGVLLALYRYLPLPVYWLLVVACSVISPLRRRLAPRLALELPEASREPVVWFHAASVGEVSTIVPVLARARRACPSYKVVLTTLTPAGLGRAKQLVSDAQVFLLPFDFLPAVRRLVSVLRPHCLVIGETEIWPNLVLELKRRGGRVVLVNGRISEKSFPRYRTIRGFLSGILSEFDLMLMRTEVDAQRIVALGARADRVKVAGNTKYDILAEPLAPDARARLRARLGIGPDEMVIALGSAREGESEVLLGALKQASERVGTRVIIAPRHLKTVSEAEQACVRMGYTYALVRDLDCDRPMGSEAVIIVAQMGRLIDIYGVSQVAVVGGTLRPFGGHNPLEPASQGCVTIVGEYIQNIRDDIDYLAARGCAFVAGEGELGPLLERVLSDHPSRRRMRDSAAVAVADKRGIAAECINIMIEAGILAREASCGSST